MKTIKSLNEAELSKLPEGWCWTKLGNITNFKNGVNFTKSQKGDIGILTLDVFNMYSKNIFPKLDELYRVNITPKEEYILKNGDILFVRSSVKREGVGWTTVFNEISEQATYCGFIIRGRLLTNDIFPEYMVYYLRTASARNNIIDSSSQVTITNINQNSLGAIPVPLSPFPEQRAIVSKIELLFSELENGIFNLKLAQEQLKVYRQAVLNKAFEGELTRKWREQQIDLPDADTLLEQIRKKKENAKASGKKQKLINSITDYELTDLSRLPKDWKWAKIGEVLDVFVGSTPSRKESKFWKGDIPWVSSGEVVFCRIYSTKESITKLGLENSSTQIHPIGTVMLGMIGEGKTRGQVAILNINACHNQNTAAIRVNSNYLPEFVYYFFMKNYNENRRIGSGNNQQALNKHIIENMKIPLCSLSEQQAIVQEIETRLSVCDKIEQENEANLERAEALRQNILKKAFEGKLLNEKELAEVRKAEDWEPAEVLLERIRTERSKK